MTHLKMTSPSSAPVSARGSGRRKAIVSTAFVLGALSFGGASADDISDCTNTTYAPKKAIEACTRLITSYEGIGWSLEDLTYNRGIAHAAMRSWREAVLDFDQVIKARPDYGPVRFRRAQAFEAIGDLQTALKDLPGHNCASRL